MKQILLLLLLLTTVAFSQGEHQKVLHVSTIPSNADIFVGELHPDHSKNPSGFAPGYIPVTGDNALNNEILISLFKPEYADTNIKVKLSDKDTSFLIVSLRPTYDDSLTVQQEKMLKKRGNRMFGHKIILGSFGPLAVAAVSGLITYYEINQAEKCKRDMKKDLLGSDDEFNKKKKNFDNYRDNAETAHTVMNVGVSLGLSLLAVGIILSF